MSPFKIKTGGHDVLNLLQIPVPLTPSSETLWAIAGIVIGVFLTGLFQFFTVNLKIKADRKRHKEDRWWELKFELFKDLEKLFSEVSFAVMSSNKEDLPKFIRELQVIQLRFLSIFEGVELANIMDRIVKEIKKSKKARQSEGSGRLIGGLFMDAIIIGKEELGIG